MSLSANTKIVAKVEKRFRLFYAYREIVCSIQRGLYWYSLMRIDVAMLIKSALVQITISKFLLQYRAEIDLRIIQQYFIKK